MNKSILVAISVIAFGTCAFAQGSSSTSVESNTDATGTSTSETQHEVHATADGGVSAHHSKTTVKKNAITGETAVHHSSTKVHQGGMDDNSSSHSESTTVSH